MTLDLSNVTNKPFKTKKTGRPQSRLQKIATTVNWYIGYRYQDVMVPISYWTPIYTSLDTLHCIEEVNKAMRKLRTSVKFDYEIQKQAILLDRERDILNTGSKGE